MSEVLGTAESKRRKRSGVKIFFSLILVVIVAALAAIIGAYVSVKASEPADLPLPEASQAYYSDGETAIGPMVAVTREVVAADQLPQVLRAGAAAAIDPQYASAPDFSITDAASELVAVVQGKPATGGSAMTKTYARMVIGAGAGLPDRVREVILKAKIDSAWDRETLLSNYLNTAYFGRGAYGAQAGAMAYFGVGASELTNEQAALLAAMLPAPSASDPAVNRDRALQGMRSVMEALEGQGLLEAGTAAAAELPETLPLAPAPEWAGPTGYLLAQVRDELIQEGGIAQDRVERGGLKIVTTIDAAAQQQAQDAVTNLPEGRPATNHVGLIAMEPASGAITAMIGGTDYSQDSANAATQGRAPAGQPFSFFTLVDGIEQGIPLDSDLLDFVFIDGQFQYQDFDGRPWGGQPGAPGILDVRSMMRLLNNAALVNYNQLVTPPKTLARAITMGLAEGTPGLDDGIGNVLGDAQVTAQEMARAYAAAANGGMLVQPHIVAQASDGAGAAVYKPAGESARVMSTDTAAMASNVLTQAFAEGGQAAGVAGEFAAAHPSAGQAGVRYDGLSATFVGYTPKLVAAVSMYQTDGDGGLVELEPFGGAETMDGRGYPLQIWTNFMAGVAGDADTGSFPAVN